MPEWLAVTLLGIVEGVTEFLPISSTGHLILVQRTGLLPVQSDLFNVVIQSGAVLAVLAVFSKRARDLVTRFDEPNHRDYLSKLSFAFVVTAAGGLLMKRLDFELPESPSPVAWATLIGGVLILIVELGLKRRTWNDQVTWGMALAVGLAQLLAAACPGSSRSGACMLAAMALGLGRPLATEFSFLVGVPTLLAAGALKLAEALSNNSVDEDWTMLAWATLVSALTAFVVVRWLLRFVQSHTLNGFGWYRILLGLLILALPV